MCKRDMPRSSDIGTSIKALIYGPLEIWLLYFIGLILLDYPWMPGPIYELTPVQQRYSITGAVVVPATILFWGYLTWRWSE
jgi:hypothetical protein